MISLQPIIRDIADDTQTHLQKRRKDDLTLLMMLLKIKIWLKKMLHLKK